MHQALRAGESPRISTTFLKLKGFIMHYLTPISQTNKTQIFFWLGFSGESLNINHRKIDSKEGPKVTKVPWNKPYGDPPTQSPKGLCWEVKMRKKNVDSVYTKTQMSQKWFLGEAPNTKTQKKVFTNPAFFSVFFSVCFFSASFAFANTFSASDVLGASFFGVVLLLHESGCRMASLKKNSAEKRTTKKMEPEKLLLSQKGISKCLLFQGSSSIQR